MKSLEEILRNIISLESEKINLQNRIKNTENEIENLRQEFNSRLGSIDWWKVLEISITYGAREIGLKKPLEEERVYRIRSEQKHGKIEEKLRIKWLKAYDTENGCYVLLGKGEVCLYNILIEYPLVVGLANQNPNLGPTTIKYFALMDDNKGKVEKTAETYAPLLQIFCSQEFVFICKGENFIPEYAKISVKNIVDLYIKKEKLEKETGLSLIKLSKLEEIIASERNNAVANI